MVYCIYDQPKIISRQQLAFRGPNVSVLHLRGTPEPPWESPVYPISRSYQPSKPTPPITKHHSLGTSYKWTNSSSNFRSSEPDELFVDDQVCNNNNRELSPVRWCDREVDGVYLGKSGWVQVQQRSLDENRRHSVVQKEPPQQKIRKKLGDYRSSNSEPGKCPEITRPGYLPLQGLTKIKSPSPPPLEEYSPPSLTPIISPPPAFQDRNKGRTKSFFGRGHFLPRSDAIVDDLSPPGSPTVKWSPMPTKIRQVMREEHFKIPQTKSLEDTTTARRSFFQHHHSSSSSSSSMGFRSLDSCVNRPVMPRLSENTDSSIDIYEDADEEDNNSSSLNLSIVSSTLFTETRSKEKISPSGRHNRILRRSPAGSDTNKLNSPGSSSTSSNEFPDRSPLGSNQQIRRTKLKEDNSQKVRRSRSLQLPDKKYVSSKISPQIPEEKTKDDKRIRKQEKTGFTKEDLIREAEVVTGFLYGNRSRAAAQALLAQRYKNIKEENNKTKPPNNNNLTVYFVSNKTAEQYIDSTKKEKVLYRGTTTPNFGTNLPIRSCENCVPKAQLMMRSSQSYPTHQRSLDSASTRRLVHDSDKMKSLTERRTSPIYGSSVSDVKKVASSKISPLAQSSMDESSIICESKCREMILTRPGSAPTDQNSVVESQQRSMSLPKSFLSVNGQG